jgi:hypothetical protein
VQLARAKNLFLMEAMWTRFMPALAEVRRVVDSGEIGKVRQVIADLGFKADFGHEHRVFNPVLGGGALLDLGIYPLSIAVALLGPVDAVAAQADFGPTGVDEQTGFLLRHRGGGMSVCSCSLRARLPSELTIAGERGHVRMNTMFHRAQTVTVVRADGISRTVPTPFTGNGYVHEAIEAQRCWQAGLIESPGMTHDDTLALMGVMDEVRRQIGLTYDADNRHTNKEKNHETRSPLDQPHAAPEARQRKKLRVGEFKEHCFDIELVFHSPMRGEPYHDFINDFFGFLEAARPAGRRLWRQGAVQRNRRRDRPHRARLAWRRRPRGRGAVAARPSGSGRCAREGLQGCTVGTATVGF